MTDEDLKKNKGLFLLGVDKFADNQKINERRLTLVLTIPLQNYKMFPLYINV